MLFRNLTIAKKGLLVLLLPLLYQALLLAVLFRRQGMQAEAQQRVIHTQDVLGQIDKVHLAMLALQGSMRGYVITENPEFDAETEGIVITLPQLLTRLSELTSNSSADQQGRVVKIDRLVRERLQWNQRLLALTRAAEWQTAREMVRELTGKRLMDELRAEVDAFREVAQRLDRERLQELQNSTVVQNRFLIGGLALNVAFGTLAIFYIVRNITRRVDRLSENARRFSRSETLLPAVRGNDELAELDRTFHEMAGGLGDARRRERGFQAVLERRNTELESANRDLDHKNQENEMFVYSVSHDLRSPLVNLQGFSKELGLTRDDLRQLFEHEIDEKARTRAKKLIDRDVSESIHYIQTAVMRLSAIIDALLRLSRAGRVDYLPEMVDLRKVLERIVTALRGSATEKGAEITVLDLPPAWGDATALEQVFANLVGNAVNYLDPKRPGRIEVGFATQPPPEAGGMPTYYVKDNGLGIAEAYLPKVFAIFQRLHSHAAKGEGVGLTLVRRMVERHGGKIWVDSKAGEGSTFYVSLPRKEESPLVVAPRKESIRVTVSQNSK